jgi:predicted RNA-binding Zn-ribbon protein involved in translation (DUF1610 family)
MVYTEAKSLATFGFNPNERITSIDSFQKQLESYALHVVEDLPVSNRYSYYLKNGRVYIDSNHQTELFIDEQERGGFAKSGTIKAIEIARNNPEKVVIFYSPPGPVAFEKGTRYDQVKDYTDGQLYLLVGSEGGDRVDCLAISVGEKCETQVLDIFLGNKRIGGFDDQKTKIIYYLTNPILGYKNIDELIAYLDSYDPNILVYTNVHGIPFTLGQVIEMIRLGWIGDIKPQINLDEILFPKIWVNDLPKNLLSSNIPKIYEENGIYPTIPNFYLQILDAYTRVYGDSYRLGGSCGGAVYSNEKRSLFENWSINDINPLSTSWRVLTSSEISDRYNDYECPSCHKKIKGELKNRPETWHKNCPHCGYSFNCKNGATNFSAN